MSRWVALWAEQEGPERLALVRLALGTVLALDLLGFGLLGLPDALWATQADGGFADLSDTWLHAVGPWPVWVVLTGAAVALACGCWTRTAALVLVVVWARLAATLPLGDRAVDLLSRDVLWVLAFAGSGRFASVDAWRATGSWRGDGRLIGSWARYLVVLQLVGMYATAGMQKTDPSWWPPDLSALFLILSDPAVTRTDFGFLRAWPAPTRLATLVTVGWQLAYPLILVFMGVSRGATSPGVRRVARSLHLTWIAVGLTFHLVLAATMELGAFPWCMMALYPALLPRRR